MRSACRAYGNNLTAAAILLLAFGCGETDQPVRWSASIEGPRTVAPGSAVRVRIEAKIARDWYFYSVTQVAGGPVGARIWLADSGTFGLAGEVSGPEPSTSFDKTFGISVEKYRGAALFTLPISVAAGASAGAQAIRVSALYQACNNRICLSPRTVTMSVPITIESR